MNRDGWTAKRLKLSHSSDMTGEVGSYLVFGDGTDCGLVINDYDEACEHVPERVVALWNAMLPFDDPSALVASWRALREALKNLESSHNFYHHGCGPCVCEAHIAARSELAKAQELDK